MERSDLAIVIPAFNEERTIGTVIGQVREFGTVIVVDDASTDGTALRAAAAGAVVVKHTANSGYDAALSSGFAKAAELGCKYTITIDADGQHDASLIREFRERLESTDIVLGVRPRKQRFAEKAFAGVTRLLYGIRDPLCGMKGYRMGIYRKLGHFDSYDSIGTELALFAVRNGYRFAQLDVPTREREGVSRFGTTLKGNYRILRSLLLGFSLRRYVR